MLATLFGNVFRKRMIGKFRIVIISAMAIVKTYLRHVVHLLSAFRFHLGHLGKK